MTVPWWGRALSDQSDEHALVRGGGEPSRTDVTCVEAESVDSTSRRITWMRGGIADERVEGARCPDRKTCSVILASPRKGSGASHIRDGKRFSGKCESCSCTTLW